MITAKFGGTCVTPHNVQKIKNVLTQHHEIVVVSAIGKQFDGDVKVTDLLQKYFYTKDEQLWQIIATKYVNLAKACKNVKNIENLLENAKIYTTMPDINACLSVGERLSAQIIAQFLSAKYVEAQDVIVFENGKLNQTATYRNIQKHCTGRCVIGGFYGGDTLGNVCTFPRGGGDVTGALCAAATNSSLYENWTDVSGVLTCSPQFAQGKTLPQLSYQQLKTLANFGAQVLHADAIQPVQQEGIPIKIANIYNPSGSNTVVSNCPCFDGVVSVTCNLQNNRYVIMVLHNLSPNVIKRKLAKLDNLLQNSTITPKLLQTKNGSGFCQIICDKQITKQVYQAFACKFDD